MSATGNLDLPNVTHGELRTSLQGAAAGTVADDVGQQGD
jgi:hypothetical protein